jgi:cob(I)alamin adenosyltransferase
MCQFLKPAGIEISEVKLAGQWGEKFIIERLTREWDMRRSSADERQVEEMRQAIGEKLGQIKQWAQEGRYDLMILDEICFCLNRGLAGWEEVVGIIEGRAEHVELVLTGRGAPEKLIDKADLVTEMREVKHPFAQGIPARKGIEY